MSAGKFPAPSRMHIIKAKAPGNSSKTDFFHYRRVFLYMKAIINNIIMEIILNK